MNRGLLVVVMAMPWLGAGCADGTEELPDASLSCGPVEECESPIDPRVVPYVDSLLCSPEPRVFGPTMSRFSVSLASSTEGCSRQWLDMSWAGPVHLLSFGVSNCCEEPRYFSYSVPGPIDVVPPFEDAPYDVPDPDLQPLLATYSFESAETVVSPSCRVDRRGGQAVCTASTACSGVWRQEVPPGHTVLLGFVLSDEVSLTAPDDFLPERLVAHLPRLEASPDAPPTLPASATLCSDDPLGRFDCYDCPSVNRTERLEVDLTQTPGVPEAIRRIFIDGAE